MQTISREYYHFLTDVLGCPYNGYVEGLGKAFCQPLLGISETPSNGSTSTQGIFLSSNYVSVVVPEAPPLSEEDQLQASRIEQYVKNKISRANNDGTIDFYDVNAQRQYKLQKGGRVDVKVTGERIYIRALDDTQRFESDSDLYIYSDDLNNAMIPFSNFTFDAHKEVPLPKEGKPVPFNKIAFDAVGNAHAYTEFKWKEGRYVKKRLTFFNGMKRQRKIKKAYDFKQALKRKYGVKVTTKTSAIVDKTIPKFFKKSGRVLFGVSTVLLAHDVIKTRGFKASHALDVAMLGISFIPPFGWVAGLAYFTADLIFMGVNYSRTQNAKSFGDYLDEWFDDQGFEDGVLWDLNPVLDWFQNDVSPVFIF
jgi:hypothetical protein